MTPPRTIIGALANAPVLRRPGMRRTLLAILVIIFVLLTFFPEKYRAAASLTPTDPTSLGLSGTLVQLGAVGSVFGNQAAVEVSLKVARGEDVRAIVVRRLKLEDRLNLSSVQAHRWLDRNVDIRSLRGGIVQFEVKNRDPELARAIVAAYGDAVREQLAIIARKQTALKRDILVELVENASKRLAAAQNRYDDFRMRTRYATPEQTVYATGNRIPELEGMIRNKEVELAQTRRFATDSNIKVQRIIAELDALKQQLAAAQSASGINGNDSIGAIVRDSTEAERLRRDLDISQILYDNYRRFLQGTSVEDLTSSANIRILEPAYIDSSRQINILPLALAILTVLLGAMIEFYALRPPLGAPDRQ